jgi:RHS repeat-associated protein
MRKATIFLGILLLGAAAAVAQDPISGFPPFGSVQPGGVDSINRQNLNVIITLPIVAVPQRGGTFAFSIVNDSLIWVRNGTVWARITDSSGNPTWGWKKEYPSGKVVYRKSTSLFKCFPEGEPWYWGTRITWSDYAYVDSAGTRHNFGIGPIIQDACTGDITGTMTGIATDGSGYYGDATNPDSPNATGPSGSVLLYSDTFTDSNGNFISKSVASNVTTWTDTAGHTALIVDKSNANYIDYKFQDTTGNWQILRLNLDTTARNIKTNFGCSGVTEYTGSDKLPVSLVNTVNNQTWYFYYENTPGFSGYTTGRLSKITMPTGGYVTYEYPSPNNGINCSDGTVLALKRRVYDASNNLLGLWDYSRTFSSPNCITTVTLPQLAYDTAANVSKYTFNASGQLVTEQHDQGSTTLMRTISTTWAANGTPASTTVTLSDTGQQTKTDTTFDNYGNLTQSIEYGWYSGSWTPVRTTQITYETGTGYASRNMRNLAKQILVREGGTSGTVKSRTDISYDQNGYINTSCPTGAAHHDDSTFNCSYTYRGLPTTVTTYTNAAAPSGNVDRHSTYDWFGNLRTADVNCCQQKQFAYSAATQYSFPDSVVSGPATGPQLTTSATYNSYTGLPEATTDENNKVTTYSFDSLKRPTTITVADGTTTIAQQTFEYNVGSRWVSVSTPIDGTFASPSKKVTKKTWLDTLGRAYKQEALDISSTLISATEVQFDALGRAYKQSNPYGSGGSASYWTETRFDALGRPLKIIPPDGSASANNTTYSYSGNTVTITDPAGKQRKSETDALGRLVTVYEPDVSDGNSLTQTTAYTYNMLDLLTGVSQGSQTRTFVYDDMGRLTSQTTPEAGQWTYTYNVFSQVETRTDARGVITTYGYDTLNRLHTVTYNVGTTGVPATNTVTYNYGESAGSNNNGRLINVTNTTVSDSFSYDPLGRITQDDRVIGGTTYTTQYAFSIGSLLTQITYPSGRVVKQDFDAAGRLCSVGASGSTCTSGTTYATGFAYNAASLVTGFSYGNGVTASFGYSAERLQMTSLAYTKNSQDLLALGYYYKQDATYCPNAPTGNNGQVQCIKDNSNTTLTPGAGGRSVTYTYDALYRLTAATTSGSTQFPAWGLSWTYDRYGNRTNQNANTGNPPQHHPTIDASTNRISGYCYDTNGNLLRESAPPCPAPDYIYDAENHLVQYGSAQYTMDGAGLRVKKVAAGDTTVYIFAGSKVLAEYVNGAGVNSPTREYLYLGSQLLAKIESGTTTYFHSDHLSARVMSNTSGGIASQSGHFPFGENWYETSANKLKFTSYERDSESGNDYAIFRTHISRFGRFSSADPLAGSISDPQSLNRYAYTLNDPTNLIDPLGLRFCLAMGVDGTCIPTGSGRWVPIYDPWRVIGYLDYQGMYRESQHPEDRYSPYYCWMSGGTCIFGYRLQGPDQRPSGSEKVKQIVNTALAHPRLQECINSIFISGISVTAQNRPWIDASRDLGAEGGLDTVGTVSVWTGRGTVAIDRDYYNDPASSIQFLAATYIHELGNYLANGVFQDAYARPLIDARLLDLFFGDTDTGANLENCVFGGRVEQSGSVTPPRPTRR